MFPGEETCRPRNSVDVLLTTAKTGRGFTLTTGDYYVERRANGGFVRNACIQKCQQDTTNALDKEKTSWQNAQSKAPSDGTTNKVSSEYISVILASYLCYSMLTRLMNFCNYGYKHSRGLQRVCKCI